MARVLNSGDIVQATIVAQDVEQVALLNFHYQCGLVSGASATDQDFVNGFDVAINGAFKVLISNNATYKGSMAQVIWPPPITRRVIDTTNAAVGSGGIIGLPRQTAGLISWKTALAGRAFRGRTYIPFPATGGDVSEGEPSFPYITNAQNLANDLMNYNVATGAGAIVVTLGVYHRRFHTIDKITDMFVPAKWATQKRRGSFGKANTSPI